jgi:hypothetical protein
MAWRLFDLPVASPAPPADRSAMKYLCLIYLDEQRLGAMPESEMGALNRRHLDFNDGLLDSGHFVEAEALQPAASATCVRMRNGKTVLTDGPYAETKEMVAGFYLIEARDLNEAVQVASRIPSAPLGTIEVRPCRDLEVDGVPYKASRKSR